MNILIVGAGPAGLAAANFLDGKRHNITIIEREKVFTTLGFGIFFFNEGKQLLKRATHSAAMQTFMKQIGLKRFIGEHGELLGDTHYNRLFHVHEQDTIASIKREDLHALLREHLPKDVTVKMDTTICALENSPAHAHVTLSDGTTETYDLVIGADGIHLQVREMLFTS